MSSGSPLLAELIEALRCLPGVGAKSAQRMAFHLLERDRGGARRLAAKLTQAVECIGPCQRCRAFSEAPVCATCANLGRDRSLLWRLLRLASAPYFVLGTGPRSSLRLRVDTPWDWNQAFELRRFDIEAQPGGQARVGWRARIRSRADPGIDRGADAPVVDGSMADRRALGAGEVEVAGHVEIRWSHGRFGGHPEAKVYLDTPHAQVPGYHPLV